MQRVSSSYQNWSKMRVPLSIRWSHKGSSLLCGKKKVSRWHSPMSYSKFLMLSRDKNTDDVWCIDSRGIATLFLSKDTYEQLGIVGKPLPFKKRVKHERGTIIGVLRLRAADDEWPRIVVQFSLRRGTDTPGNVARRHAALRAWDKRREEEMGARGWHVIYCCKGTQSTCVNQSLSSLIFHPETLERYHIRFLHLLMSWM